MKSIPTSWRLSRLKYKLIGTKCKSCNEVFFPPRVICPNCRNNKIEQTELSGNGIIHSFTIIRTAPEGFEDQVPYVVGVIKLDEGPFFTGQIVKPIKNIKIGKRVKIVFRRLSEHEKSEIINYGLKFRIIE